jgi:dual specificity tyrosine-phosphorylation-regulated kinase 2/3/4
LSPNKIYTYIQSRFYRAPEVILGISYTPAIDMWSFGCILYELFNGYPLFAGENENEQLQWIMEIKGIPPNSVLVVSSRRKNFFENDYKPILEANTRGKVRKPGSKTLKELMNCDDENFVDFIDKWIEWKVEDRMTPEEAQQHEWIKEGLREIS